MYAADAANAPFVLDEAYRAAGTAAGAMLAGWLSERALDTGLGIPGIAPLAGFLGLYAGRAIWSWTGWSAGPLVVGFPVVPAIAGTLAVCTALKLVGLGLAGPRR